MPLQRESSLWVLSRVGPEAQGLTEFWKLIFSKTKLVWEKAHFLTKEAESK